VEECDFDRQFLFDEYVAISHRYDLKRVSLKSKITVLSSYVKFNCLATFMMHDSLLNFHSVFLDKEKLYKKNYNTIKSSSINSPTHRWTPAT
jgi:hypothetical protein